MTANHLLLDAVAGGTVLAIGFAIAAAAERPARVTGSQVKA